MDTETHDMSLSPEIDRIIEDVLRGTADCRETALPRRMGGRFARQQDYVRAARPPRSHEPGISPLEIDTEKSAVESAQKEWASSLPGISCPCVLPQPWCFRSAWRWRIFYCVRGNKMPMWRCLAYGALSEVLWRPARMARKCGQRQQLARISGRLAGKERRVSLSGEGYFEVNADTEHPFIVRAW